MWIIGLKKMNMNNTCELNDYKWLDWIEWIKIKSRGTKNIIIFLNKVIMIKMSE